LQFVECQELTTRRGMYPRGVDGVSFAPVDERDQTRVIGTLVSAFLDDPVERWLFPESHEYLAHFPRFVAAFGGKAFEQQSAWTVGDFEAVAVWIPPGSEPDTNAIVDVLSESVAAERHDDMFSVLEQMDAAHPKYPHWYLPWLGVDRTRQGTGLGGQLLKHCLAVVDADHLPAFLETPNPRTIPFYERHGFAVTSAAQAGTCPPVTSMLRSPH
jgi:GNAT superfamily N-acetyltransferase